MRIILVRHALTDWNMEERCHGITDVPLGEYGKAMAIKLAEPIGRQKFDAIYCSNLLRAKMTLDLMMGIEMPAIVTDARLRERDFGKMEGNTHRRGMELWPEEVSAWLADHTYTMEGGETYDAFTDRVQDFIKQILRDCEGKTVLIVAHGGSLRAILRYLGNRFGTVGIDSFISHACYADLEILGNKMTVRDLNNCEHLRELEK